MRVCTRKAFLFAALSLLVGIPAQVGAADKKVEVTDNSFRCLRQNQRIRSMYVDNILGNMKGTLAVAESDKGGVYPPGTVLQLIPGEAMVKREKGTSPETKDWEFFSLEVTAEGTKIKARGFAEMKSTLGGSCLTCHRKAAPQWDMTCEQGHGCDPIVVPDINALVLINALQKTDPRCPAPESLTPEEQAELKKLQELLKKQAAAEAETVAGGPSFGVGVPEEDTASDAGLGRQ